MVSLMERRTKEVRASVADIADYSRLSRETVKRSTKWLEENKILTVVRRKKPLTNSYKINYAPPNRVTGEPLDPPTGTFNRLTSEPLIGSPVSLSEGLNARGDQEVCQTPIDILEISTKTVKRAASGEGDEMILGQDPERKSDPEKKQPGKVLPKMNNLVNQFLSDPRTVMTSTYEMRDILILRRTLNTLKGSGLTEFDLSQMIKRFLDVDHWRNSDNPVLIFSNKEVQKKLMEQVDVTISVDDPSLLWLISDFDRTEANPEWPEEYDQKLKRLVISEAMDTCYRYPEVVVQCILNHGGLPGLELQKRLSALNSLVRILAGDENGDLQAVHSEAWQPDLPPELDKPSAKATAKSRVYSRGSVQLPKGQLWKNEITNTSLTV